MHARNDQARPRTPWREPPGSAATPIIAALLAALLALPLAASAGSCTNERPRELFEALEAIDEAGEQRLKERLTMLSEREGWSASEWQDYVASLADTPQAAAGESRRDELVAAMFGLLARPPYDCDALDRLEAEILAIERQQWEASIETVERRLARDGDYL